MVPPAHTRSRGPGRQLYSLTPHLPVDPTSGISVPWVCTLSRPHGKTDFGHKHPKGFKIFTNLPKCSRSLVQPGANSRPAPLTVVRVAHEQRASQC